MKKNSFSRQLCVSLKMINDVMILPCIRELENSLRLGALVTSPRCCSCSPKHEGRRALAWRGLLGGQGGSPIPLGGLGQSRDLSPLPALSCVCGRAAARTSASTFGVVFVPPSPGTAPPARCERPLLSLHSGCPPMSQQSRWEEPLGHISCRGRCLG